MELFQKLIMQEKDMYLKKNKNIFYLFVCFLILFNRPAISDDSKIEVIKKYLAELEFFSASFIQNDNETTSEGNIYIGKQRVRVEYKNPTKILVILDKDNAMYYNYDLDEDEFFNPRDTPAWFFYDIFNSLNFFDNAKIISSSNNVILEKTGYNETEIFKIEVFFEDNPLILRRIKLNFDGEYLSLSIFDHRYNEVFDKRFFKLINPSLLD